MSDTDDPQPTEQAREPAIWRPPPASWDDLHAYLRTTADHYEDIHGMHALPADWHGGYRDLEERLHAYRGEAARDPDDEPLSAARDLSSADRELALAVLAPAQRHDLFEHVEKPDLTVAGQHAAAANNARGGVLMEEIYRYVGETERLVEQRTGQRAVTGAYMEDLEKRLERAGAEHSDLTAWRLSDLEAVLQEHAPAQRGELLRMHPERGLTQKSALQHADPTLLSRARGLIASVQGTSPTTVAQALEAGWPSHQQAADPLTRARVCCALAFETAATHREHAHRRFGEFPAVDAQAIVLPEASRDKPALHPFDLAAAQACEAVHGNPVWRAAKLLVQEPTTPEALRAHCEALCASLTEPLKQICVERDAFEASLQLAAAPVHTAPSATYVRRAPSAHDYDNLQTYAAAANTALRDKESLAQDVAAFRVANASDQHLELQPVLTRTLGGREFQVLRPLSGPQVLILAYTTDLHASPGHGKSLRFRAPPARTPAPRPARRSHGVEW